MNKICQNCKNQFTIEPEDFVFYDKIQVPAPTFCPECRMVRRMVWRNERGLYQNKDIFSGKDLISIFPSGSFIKVIDHKTWWGDLWSPIDFGQDYDFDKTFFEQWHVLFKKVPFPNIASVNSVNSDYSHSLINSKNC